MSGKSSSAPRRIGDGGAPALREPAPAAGAAPLGLTCERWWRSPLDPSRCYAVRGDLFFKIALSPLAAAPPRRQDLRGEAELLRRCLGVPGVPGFVAWTQSEDARVLVMRRIGARPLCQLDLGWSGLVRLLPALALLVIRLAWRGVSHDDLRPENILVDDAGRLHLIDFDQASTGSFARCLVRSLLGLAAGGAPVSNAIAAPLREHLQALLPPALIRFLKGRRNRKRRANAGALPPLPPAADPALRRLHAAWRLAASAGANAPGAGLAYYELEVAGLRLPGERPWALRWQSLRGATSYRGRRVLELGCNLSLLSTFLLRHAGAAAALAVDRNPAILEAAAMAAAAYGVRPEFRELDLDDAGDWESALAAFHPDVVFALSLCRWVQDQPRLLAFLGRFEELIYEGHDSARTERRRLRAAGFEEILVVDTSERGRPILHCRRRPRR